MRASEKELDERKASLANYKRQILEFDTKRREAEYRAKHYTREAIHKEWDALAGGRTRQSGRTWKIVPWDTEKGPYSWEQPEGCWRSVEMAEWAAGEHTKEMAALTPKVQELKASIAKLEKVPFWERVGDLFLWPFLLWSACRKRR